MHSKPCSRKPFASFFFLADFTSSLCWSFLRTLFRLLEIGGSAWIRRFAISKPFSRYVFTYVIIVFYGQALLDYMSHAAAAMLEEPLPWTKSCLRRMDTTSVLGFTFCVVEDVSVGGNETVCLFWPIRSGRPSTYQVTKYPGPSILRAV